MSLFSQLLGIAALGGFFSCILFVAFGQITVRKLRKNPATKERLGVEFTSGWDILNVAGALSTPKWLRDRFNRSSLSFMVADHQALYENTNRFDRVLGRIFWFFYITSATLMILLMIVNAFGFFD
jgi:hypothetical protein